MANGGRASAGTGTRSWTIHLHRYDFGPLNAVVEGPPIHDTDEPVVAWAKDDVLAALWERADDRAAPLWQQEWFDGAADFLAELFKEGSDG